MPTLAEALRAAPTTRAYRADPFPLDLLGRALELAGAASAEPWRAVAVTDAAKRTAVRDAYLPHWHAYLRETGGLRILADDAPAQTARMLRRADDLAARLELVPVHLVVTGPADRMASALAAARELPARLADEGLAGTALPAGAALEDELRALLGLPQEVGVAALLAVGHSEGHLSTRRARPGRLADLDTWGAAW